VKFSWPFFGAIMALGLVGGALSGLLGIGSGIIMVPVLSALWAKDPDAQKIAQGTALAVMVPMTVAGALSYHFGGQQSNLRLAVLICVWSLIIGGLALSVGLRCGSLVCVTTALGHVNWHYVTLLAVGGVLGSTFLGAPLAAAIPSELLKRIFGIFLIIVGLRMAGIFAYLGSHLVKHQV
jgi:uncharacterized membrane protein YfcA